MEVFNINNNNGDATVHYGSARRSSSSYRSIYFMERHSYMGLKHLLLFYRCSAEFLRRQSLTYVRPSPNSSVLPWFVCSRITRKLQMNFNEISGKVSLKTRNNRLLVITRWRHWPLLCSASRLSQSVSQGINFSTNQWNRITKYVQKLSYH